VVNSIKLVSWDLFDCKEYVYLGARTDDKWKRFQFGQLGFIAASIMNSVARC